MPQKKQIRELKRPTKSSPRCRETIEARGWIPHVLCDRNGPYWDGITLIDASGELVNGLSDDFQKETLGMILDGYFGEEVKDVWRDEAQYWRIRDELITWPNHESIATRALRVLEVRRGD